MVVVVILALAEREHRLVLELRQVMDLQAVPDLLVVLGIEAAVVVAVLAL